MTKNKFTVIRDTREQNGWFFKESDYCSGMVDRKLDTGDYSIEGLEDILCIERKASTAEIANNFVDKRFDRELERMTDFEFRFLLLEFSLEDVRAFPVGSDIPKKTWSKLRVSGNFLMKKITEIQTHYGVHVVPCGDKLSAWHMASSIMKRIYEKAV